MGGSSSGAYSPCCSNSELYTNIQGPEKYTFAPNLVQAIAYYFSLLLNSLNLQQ